MQLLLTIVLTGGVLLAYVFIGFFLSIPGLNLGALELSGDSPYLTLTKFIALILELVSDQPVSNQLANDQLLSDQSPLLIASASASVSASALPQYLPGQASWQASPDPQVIANNTFGVQNLHKYGIFSNGIYPYVLSRILVTIYDFARENRNKKKNHSVNLTNLSMLVRFRVLLLQLVLSVIQSWISLSRILSLPDSVLIGSYRTIGDDLLMSFGTFITIYLISGVVGTILLNWIISLLGIIWSKKSGQLIPLTKPVVTKEKNISKGALLIILTNITYQYAGILLYVKDWINALASIQINNFYHDLISVLSHRITGYLILTFVILYVESKICRVGSAILTTDRNVGTGRNIKDIISKAQINFLTLRSNLVGILPLVGAQFLGFALTKWKIAGIITIIIISFQLRKLYLSKYIEYLRLSKENTNVSFGWYFDLEKKIDAHLTINIIYLCFIFLSPCIIDMLFETNPSAVDNLSNSNLSGINPAIIITIFIRILFTLII